MIRDAIFCGLLACFIFIAMESFPLPRGTKMLSSTLFSLVCLGLLRLLAFIFGP